MMRFYPKPLAFALLLGLCFGVVGAFAVSADSDRESLKKIKVGVVGDMTDTYLELGLVALRDFDSSRFSVDLLTLEKEEADGMLRSGEISCYLLLPDGFAESASRGEYEPLTVVTDSASPGFAASVVKEVATVAEDLVLESQNGVFGAQKYITDKEDRYAAYAAIQDLAANYAAKIISRDSVFETEVDSPTGSVGFSAYLICGLGVFLLLLWGVVFAPVLACGDMSLEKLLSARGTGSLAQSVGRLVSYFFTMWLTVLIACLGAAAALRLGAELPSSQLYTVSDFVLFSLRLVPACLAVCSLQLFLYECADSLADGIILQFVTALLLGYVSGCFYPPTFFPEAVQSAARYLPSGAALDSALSCFSGAAAKSLGAPLLLSYTALFTLASAAVRRAKIKGARR